MSDKITAALGATLRELDKANDEIINLDKANTSLVKALKEVTEIYAGMDGFISETAPEGYQQYIIRQMYEVSKKALIKPT